MTLKVFLSILIYISYTTLRSSVVAISSTNHPFQLISIDGICKTENQINKFLESSISETTDSSSPIGIIDVIDCTGDNDVNFINTIFNTKFQIGTGISLAVIAQSKAILYSSFNTMYSTKFCGSKSIDYQCSLCRNNNICLVMKSEDFDHSLAVSDQIFRRIIKVAYEQRSNIYSNNVPMEISIVIDEQLSIKENEIIDYGNKVETFLNSLWSEKYSKVRITEVLTLKVVVVKRSDPSTIIQANQALISESTDDSNKQQSIVLKDLAGVLHSKWTSIPTDLTPILSPIQKESLYIVEMAYIAGLTQIDVTISQWQSRVSGGKTVGKFASRVAELLHSVKSDFNKKVIGTHQVVRERGERLRLLREYVLTSADRLFRQQLLIIEFMVTNKFRKELGSLAALDSIDDTKRKEQEQLVLRKSIFEYKTLATDLEDIKLGLTLTDEKINEFSTVLTTILTEFPETSTAKLEEIRKIEREAKSKKGATAASSSGRGRKRKGLAKALGVSLQLVGMLRPPGYGSLQGFIGYNAASLLGLPLELLLGVQNDGDSPEIMGEDREYPILRLQPKVNFDIDL